MVGEERPQREEGIRATFIFEASERMRGRCEEERTPCCFQSKG